MSYSQKAYTLFELMLALAIIAILSAIAVPGLRNLIDHNNDSILQASLLQTIQLARQEAYAKGRTISICKSKNHLICGGEWSDGLLIFVDDQGCGVVKDKQHIISIMQIKPNRGNIYWRAYPNYRDYLRFTPAKWPLADNGTFWYCRPKRHSPTFAIVISKSGEGHVVNPDINGKIRDSRGRVIDC